MRLSGLIIILLALCSKLSIAQASDFSIQRIAFLAAEKALQRGQLNLYQSLKPALSNYPLYPYLEYQEISGRLAHQTSDNIENFINRYPETVVANRLRDRWLNYLSKHRRWDEYLRFYEQDWSTIRHCHYLNALVKNGKSAQAFPEIEAMWLYPKSRPGSCDPAFKALANAGHLSDQLRWQRISLAMDKGQLQLATYLARKLPADDVRWVDRWVRAHRHPESVMHTTRFDTPHPYRDTILSHGIKRQARGDALLAAENWAILKQRHAISPLVEMLTERQIALSMFRNKKIAAYEYLTDFAACSHDTRVQETRLLAALIHRDWKNIKVWVKELPPTYANSERWQYWYARALSETGDTSSATEIFETLATLRSYYGFLAADKINAPYNLDNRATPVTEKSMEQVGANPSVLRAGEFVALERWLDARREWNQAIHSMSRSQLMAASKLAQSWQWHDQAIFTLARTQYWEDLDLRFPLEHRQQVDIAAKNYALDMAWIYAVIRQESAFNASVRSSAGAIGLMQLMPATARDVSIKMLKQPTPSTTELKQPRKNIELGTTYLNHVLGKLDQNPVLATAAYNAGPHRVARWLPEQSMPADIWIELIPYKETRNYVKRVMEYSVIYNKLLKLNAVRVGSRMPVVSGTNGT